MMIGAILRKWKKRKLNNTVSANNTFLKKSLCDGGTLLNIMFNYAVILFIFLLTILYPYYTRKISEQLGSAYWWLVTTSFILTILRRMDANDPSEWCKFFIKYAEKNMVACTIIIIDKSEFILSLMKRRVSLCKVRVRESILQCSNLFLTADRVIEKTKMYTKDAIKL